MISSHVDTSWKSLKVTEKTPILEDPYLEFCNSIWPHFYTVGKVFQLAKTFQKTPKFENAQKYLKMHFFVYAWLSLCATRASLTTLVFCKSRMHIFTGCSCVNSRIMRGLSSCIVVNLFLNIKTLKHAFRVSLGSYTTDSFSCNYFVFAPNFP